MRWLVRWLLFRLVSTARELKWLRQARHFNHYYGEPLTLKIEQGALVIRIGAETLAHALQYAEWANPWNEVEQNYTPAFRVVDPPELAADVLNAMRDEAEDGSTPLTRFLDRMMQEAIENGSLSVEENT